MIKTEVIGKPIDRKDGRAKVTGAAKYAAEFNQPKMAYAFPVRSTIGNGTIISFDTSAAEKADGVLKILTYQNAPRLKELNPQEMRKTGGQLGENLLPLQDSKVNYFGEYIALVVAETYEQARTAAELVKVNYAKQTAATDLKTELAGDFKSKGGFVPERAQTKEGDAAAAINSAAVKIEQTYTTPTENHQPMEPHATVAVWDGADKLTIYDSTQGVKGAQGVSAYLFDLKPENVQVLSPYVGGGFGCKGSQWAHVPLTVMAAKAVNRPVKFAITRQMMVANVGRRPETIQTIALASDKAGKLSAMRHQTDSYAAFSQYFEQCGTPTKILYNAPNREITYKIAKLNYNSPTYMRAPGETPGTFALESAMDELAFELKIDPIQLRTINHTANDPLEKLPFSSEYLLDCYKIGAEKFGWANRKSQPRSNRSGKYLVGYGMATATYPAYRSTASAKVQMYADGTVKVFSATQDIGTGTYTILAQTIADVLGVPVGKVSVEIGDSSFPAAPVSGGSTTAASVTAAVLAAGEMVKKDLMAMAIADGKSKLNGRRAEEVEFASARFFVKGDSSKGDDFTDILKRNNKNMIEACATSLPQNGGGLSGTFAPCAVDNFAQEEDADAKKYSFHSFGAQFAEVRVDEDLGTIRVSRFTSVQDIGQVLNEKTARSQIIGGVIYGLGQVLMEETMYDKRWANPITRTLADYHVPVNLDVPEIDVHFIGKPDPHISPIGARGIGEIGITGVAAAVANAVFNATGKRLRDLPLTPDKLV
ncbi:MAG: xanthine dehydrogenase family protein molybdopterin-binding subunit [Pyrinomonadaceae bacterium]